MPVINTVYNTVTCEGLGCTKTVTFLAQDEQVELAKPENAWVLKTARNVVNLIAAPGQQKPVPHLYCSDECEVKATATGIHNVPEPKQIVSEPASAQAVAAAAAAAKRAEQATAALRAGGPVTLG
jgi:threonine synthase